MDFFSEGFFFLIKHFEKGRMLEFALDIGIFSNVSATLDENIEGCSTIAFLGKLDFVIILIMCAVGK